MIRDFVLGFVCPLILVVVFGASINVYKKPPETNVCSCPTSGVCTCGKDCTCVAKK